MRRRVLAMVAILVGVWGGLMLAWYAYISLNAGNCFHGLVIVGLLVLIVTFAEFVGRWSR